MSIDNINKDIKYKASEEEDGIYFVDGMWADKQTLDIYQQINDAVSSIAADAFRRLIFPKDVCQTDKGFPFDIPFKKLNVELVNTIDIWSKSAAILISQALSEYSIIRKGKENTA